MRFLFNLNSYFSFSDKSFRSVRLVSSSWMIQKPRPSIITLKPTKIQSLVSFLSLRPIYVLITTVPAKPNRPSLIKSISKGGGNINKSMISHPKEGAFVHVAHMGYNADSGFTSTGVDPSWTALLESLHGYLGKEVVADDMDFIKDFIRNYSERQQNRSLAAPRRKLPPPPPKRIKLTPPPSPPEARTQPPQVAPHRPVSPVVEDEQLPPTPPPRRPTPPRIQPPQVAPHVSISPVVDDEKLPPTPPPRRPTPSPVRTQSPPVTPYRPISPVVEDEELPPTPPPRRQTPPAPVRTQPPPGAPHRPISPVVEDEQLPPTPPPRRPTPPTTTHGAPRTPERPLPPQPGDLPLSQELEPKEATAGIPYSRPHYLSVFRSSCSPFDFSSASYRKSPPFPLVLSHSNSRIRSNSPSITPSNSTSMSSAGAVIRQEESQSVDLPFPISEAVPEDEVESDITQTVKVPSQRSWILASRIPRASKKPVDEFMTYMADRRRQTNDSDESSTNSSPRVSRIIPRCSITSSAFSQSYSISSPPPGAVLFPPTPVFKDEFPKGIIQRVKSLPLDSSTSRGFVNRN